MDRSLQMVSGEIGRHYADRLIAVALFGSRARQRPRIDSDWDVLLVMAPTQPIRRALYREWDELVAPAVETLLPGVSPHFVHLPASGDEPSPLWLEVASAHRILADRSGELAACLRRIRELIEDGRYERRVTHGLSYWRKAV
ncbi:MAG: nucleotidyltransferase domain-containing protein [Candidatus Binatia bacterium]